MPLMVLATAPDRPGLARTVGQVVHGHRGNIETSRMVTLGREFVIAALVTGADVEGAAAAIQQQLEAEGFAVVLRPTTRPEASAQLPYAVRAVALDHPGIVEQLAAAIREVGGNIVDAETEVVPAPWSGAPTFTFEAKVLLPDGNAARDLRNVLIDLEVAENLDIRFESLQIG